MALLEKIMTKTIQELQPPLNKWSYEKYYRINNNRLHYVEWMFVANPRRVFSRRL